MLSMPIPNLESMMLPMLKLLGDKKDHTMNDIEKNLAILFGLTESEKIQPKPSGGETLFHNRLHWAKFYLKKAQLISTKTRGPFRITELGLNVLKENPRKIDTSYLMKFHEFANFIKMKKK